MRQRKVKKPVGYRFGTMTDRALAFLRRKWQGQTDTELVETAIIEKAFRDGWDGKDLGESPPPHS